jgi:hypothetical protein
LVKELDPAWNIKVTPGCLTSNDLSTFCFPKVTIIEPGPFRTKMSKENQRLTSQHPAYANPELPSSQLRQFFSSGNIDGDVDKAVVVIEKLTHLDDVPMRLPLHRKVIASTRDKIKSLTEDLNKFESWSDDVYH